MEGNTSKKKWLEENWFKLGILIAVFLLIYSVVIVPQREEKIKQAETEATKSYAKNSYDTCVSLADLDYSTSWGSRCLDYREFNEKGWADCMNMPYATKSICDSTWNKGPTDEEIASGNCSLPTSWAESLESARDKRKTECMNDYQMKVGTY